MVVPAPTHATPHLNRYASLLLLLISITVIVSMSLVLYTSSTTSHHRIMVGTQDTMWVNGFHSEETSTDTNQSFRWSKEMSTIHIPLIHQGWNTVTLYALGSPSRNQGQEVGTDVAITIATNTRHIHPFGSTSSICDTASTAIRNYMVVYTDVACIKHDR